MTRWIGLVNRLLLLLLLATTLSAVLLWSAPKRESSPLITNAATSSQVAKTPPSITGPLLALRYEPPAARLPNLSEEFVYTGLNGRPDADPQELVVHLALQGEERPLSIPLNRPLYLLYDKGGSYQVQEGEATTSLWITPRAVDGDPSRLQIDVGMSSQQGDAITKPEEHSSFTLTQSAKGKGRRERWQLGPHRADNSLLARMRTRWFGPDQLLELHGSQENPIHRIDFGDEASSYSCFIELGGILYWDKERWNEPEEGVDTRLFPILHLKACEERLAHIDVWDCEGKRQLSIKLIRHKEGWGPDQLIEEMSLVGARSWSKFILELSGDRIEVSPDDWLIREEGSWRKLQTAEELESIVAGERQCELLIIEEVQRSEGRTLLQAHLFSPMRGEVASLSLPLVRTGQVS